MVLVFTPQGTLRVGNDDDDARALLDLALHDAPPTDAALEWARSLGRLVVDAARLMPEWRGDPLVLDRQRLDELASSPPPIHGAEYISSDLLERVARRVEARLRSEIGKSTIESFLHRRAPHLSVVGRVCFHLAENRRDPERPFAFIATYATRLGDDERVRHRPLGDALREYAAARAHRELVALMSPVQRAAESSPLVRTLVDERLVFHPLAWSAREAHAFLHEVPAIEAAGVVVRVPDWWSSRRPPRARLSMVVGAKPATGLGVEAMLDVSAMLTVDGEVLTKEEIDRLLASTDGLVLLRGRWVLADRERLQEVLAHWKQAERAVSSEGITFADAMRLLAGATADTLADEPDLALAARSEWVAVSAGPWLDELLARLRDLSDGIDPTRAVKAELRPYQKQGVRWLHLLASLGLGALLADDMGLGKTLQVIALFAMLEKGPHLVVVPASLVGNWSREIARFAPRLAVVHLDRHATSATLARADVAIVTYGMLLRHRFLAEARFRTVVLDEAQAIKNPAAKQTRAAKSLKADARIALTGTPVENRLGDLWSIFDFITPGLLGNARAFTKLTKRLLDAGGPGIKPLRTLIKPYVLRRLKTDRSVIDDLPDKTEVKVECGLSKLQAALYRSTVDGLARMLDKEKGLPAIERRGLVLAHLLRFKQICDHPSLHLGDRAFEPMHSGKMMRMRAIVEEIAARQEKVLVFTQFKSMTKPLATFLASIFGRPGSILHGETATTKRLALVDDFQSEAGAPFFVLSLKAGGTGLNLTAASHVIHFDRWWNPAVEDQATDRAYRIGQKRNVLVHKLVCRGTIEERIDALLIEKRATADALLAGGNEIDLGGMSRDALMRLVALDIDDVSTEAASV